MSEEGSEEKFSISNVVTRAEGIRHKIGPNDHHEINEYLAKHLLKHLGNKLKERESTETPDHYAIYISEFNILQEQYEKQLEERDVHLRYTLWLSLQVAMSLTDQEKRRCAYDNHLGNIINETLLSQKHSRPNWQNSYDVLGESTSLSKLIGQIASYGPFPFPLIGQDSFTKEDYIEFYSKEILGYSLKAGDLKLHGQLFSTPIQATLHDLIHLYEHVAPTNSSSFYSVYATAYPAHQRLAGAVTSLLSSESAVLTPIEKKKLATVVFHGLHEVDTSIVARGGGWRKRDAMLCLLEHCETHIKEIFPDSKNSLKDFEINRNNWHYKNEKPEEVRRKFDSQSYPYLKQFYRDIPFSLIQDGLLTQEDCRKDGEPYLGIHYEVTPIREKFLEMVHWVQEELKEGGRLYPYFKPEDI